MLGMNDAPTMALRIIGGNAYDVIQRDVQYIA